MSELSLSKQCGDEPLGDLIDKWCQEGMQIKPHGTSFALTHYVASKAYQHGLRRSKGLCVNTNLSPTAHAILAAAGGDINIVAALRAAVRYCQSEYWSEGEQRLAKRMLMVADELEAQ